EAIILDGNLDESFWSGAMLADKFKSYFPEYGKDMPYKTEIYLAYNAENLLFGFKCFDPNPDNIKATMAARDQIRIEDWVCINLDPFNDQQSLYAFYANPLGIQMDSRASSNNEDTGADFIFYSKGLLTESGYQVEIKIPFKSLRYKRSETVTMGMIIERRIHHLSINGTYPALDPRQGMNFLTQMLPFELSGIKHYTLLELLPAVTYSRISEQKEGKLGLTRNKPELSLTSKIGLTSQLSLDLTYNPDFSQVEADAGQIEENQRYSLYYKEKRPFFQEGKESFNIAAASEFGSFQSVVHTRQIANPLIGVKLSGKISAKSRMALLYSLDEPFSSNADTSKLYSNFFVGRYQYALKKDSYVGLVFTDREDPDQYNRLAGFDGRFRLNDASAIEYHLFGSASTDNDSQKQRTGIAGTISYRQQNKKRNLSIDVQHLGNDFETRTGYLQRNGINRLFLTYKPNFYLQNSFFTKISPMSFFVLSQVIDANLWEKDLGLGIELSGDRSSIINTFINPSSEVFLGKTFRTNSFHFRGMSQILPSLFIMADYRFGESVRYVENPYSGYGHKGSIQFTYQALTSFQTELCISYSDFYKATDSSKDFDYLILRSKNTYQLNKYLFFRIIVEYNSFYNTLTSDLLASFTYIPGTVVHLGYGSLYEQKTWTGRDYQPGSEFTEMKRGFFFKASYLFRT
ncbi:MAG: carbohydrate binding family 9 domain-containing protein, partial [Bacteroidetes bacterium]|nr:carbohydrate binding family 9 domain-containing protein [Bacteroidota bacterium]